VSATITNTGSMSGAEVAQLYVGFPSSVGEPPRQLKGFAKVSLAPGQSATVSFPLTSADLSYYDTATNGFVAPAGTFQVYVGDSSALANLPLQGSFTVSKPLAPGTGTGRTPAPVVTPGRALSPPGPW
jgi:beta-glucosidase